MSRRFDLIVFDWDGTLSDSVAHIVTTMRAAIGDLGLPEPPEHAMRGVIGLGLREALADLFPAHTTADHDRVRSQYRERFLASGVRASLFAGARELLEQLSADGYTLAIATGKGRAGLDRELAETDIGHLIAASRCADECPSKPAPDMLEQLMWTLDHDPGRTVMVGDAEFDLLMARNAGTASVGVAGGAHATDRLFVHQPLAVLDRVTELPRVITPVR